MKNLLNKFGLQRLIVVAITAFACVCMWGCGDWFPEDREREFFGYYSRPHIVGFVDDSLVIVADSREWMQETPDYAIGGHGHQRLRVFNYRVQEDGPRWTDTLDNFTDEFDYVKGQVSDSVIWGAHGDELISFWKLGEKPKVHEISVEMDGCNQTFAVQIMRTWVDETIIAFNENSLRYGDDRCQYAVLDTIAKTFTYKRLDENLKWIEKCDDVRAWSDDVVCLKKRNAESLSLIVNNKEMDSIFVNAILLWDSLTISLAPLSFYGSMFYCAYVNSIDFEKWKIKLEPNIRPLNFPSFGEFINEKKSVVSY